VKGPVPGSGEGRRGHPRTGKGLRKEVAIMGRESTGLRDDQKIGKSYTEERINVGPSPETEVRKKPLRLAIRTHQGEGIQSWESERKSVLEGRSFRP